MLENLRRQLKLKYVRRRLRCYSPHGREQFLAVMNKRDGKELPREIIEKAKAMVEGAKAK